MATYSEKAEKATGLHLSDAHFHLGFVSNPVDFAAKAQRAEVPFSPLRLLLASIVIQRGALLGG